MSLRRHLFALLLVATATIVSGFRPLSPSTSSIRPTTTSSSALQSTPRTRDASAMMQDMRAEMAKNEDANLIMQALRGQNLNDDDAQVAGLQMQLVDIGLSDEETGLPYDYNPRALREFFSKRPLAVLQRIVQLTTTGGNFALNLLLDNLLKRNERNPDLEVQRAGELRDLVTSLGPFYIKVGQALSIRPDILSPRSMVELQKLCDKVPSYDSKIAFATIEAELGKPVDELFSEITPEPVAAGKWLDLIDCLGRMEQMDE